MTPVAQIRRKGIEGFAVAPGQRNSRALCMHRPRDRSADPAGCAGYEYLLVSQCEHIRIPDRALLTC